VARSRVALASLARDVVEHVRPTAGARILQVQGDEVDVPGDEDRLRQLLTNLVENAVHYTAPDGTIVVSLALASASSNRLQHTGQAARLSGADQPMLTDVALTVRDNGIGVEAEHLPHLFERFYRADAARSRVDGGAGLGLAICEYIAQVHGGRIEAASPGPRQGSTFTVTLPAYPAAHVHARPVTSGSKASVR
jgi:signal transduction histidine kinase